MACHRCPLKIEQIKLKNKANDQQVCTTFLVKHQQSGLVESICGTSFGFVVEEEIDVNKRRERLVLDKLTGRCITVIEQVTV